MAWYDSKQNGVCQWLQIINQFQLQKAKININIEAIIKKDYQNVQSLNTQNLFLNGSLFLNQIKTYNKQVTEFIRKNMLILVYEGVKFVLQVPDSTSSQERKYKFPILAIQFLEGIISLPNILLINLMNQNLYEAFCTCIFYFYQQNIAYTKQKVEQQYQNSLYQNYFQRLFNLPRLYSKLQQAKGGVYSNMTASVTGSIAERKISFFESLIQVIQKNCRYGQILAQNIRHQSILSCIRSIILMNGMYNCPLKIKIYIIQKGIQYITQYNQNIKAILKKEVTSINNSKQTQEVQNIIRLFIQIIVAALQIYDGKKMYDAICTKNMLKLCIQIISANFIYFQNNLQRQTNTQNSILVPSFLEQKIIDLLQNILKSDLNFSKSGNQISGAGSIIQQLQINELFLMIHSLKIIKQKNRKIKIKDVSLVKMFNLMLSNPQKYDIIDKVKKYSFFQVLFELVCKNNQNDIFLHQVNKIFLSIFKLQVGSSLQAGFPSQSFATSKNFQDLKASKQLFQEKLFLLSFQAIQIIPQKIGRMKSHKDPLFGHFFKLCRCVKQFCRNYLKHTDPQLLAVSSSVSQSSNSSISVSFNLQDFQLIHKNEYIRSKCKEWYGFYQKTFAQLQTNYYKQLGKFDQFAQLAPNTQTQFTVRRYGEVNSVTNSQFINNKEQIQASMKASMEILSLNNLGQQFKQSQKQNQKFDLCFKKQNKNKKFEDNSPLQNKQSKLLTKNQIQSLQEPIKIQFTKINSDAISSQSQNDQQLSNTSERSEEAQQTFQNYMKKKYSQINQNKQTSFRKKSKTPTKFKSSSQSKTPPKQKKWGNITAEKTQNVQTINEKQGKKNLQLVHPIQRRAKSHQKQKLQQLKERLIKNKNQFNGLKFLKVGKRIPKIYKERQINSVSDAKIFSLLRG